MKRLVLVLTLIVLSSRIANAQESLLPTVQVERAKYGVSLSPTQLADLLNAVAWTHRHQGWGLLSKAFGTKCPAPQLVFVACDVLVHLPTAHHFDVLRDAEGAAEPVWRDAGMIELNRFVMPMDPNQGTPSPIPPEPLPQIPSVDLTPVLIKLGMLHDDHVDMKVLLAELKVAFMTHEHEAKEPGHPWWLDSLRWLVRTAPAGGLMVLIAKLAGGL